MKPPIGFVIVTYNLPDQTLLLCERLNAMFQNPPISIHHDFSQSSLNPSIFSRNVRFVEKWQQTGWGAMTVVDAQLSALRLLYTTEDPDWFVPLSTSDYPIQTADYILRDLMNSEVDAFMDSRRLEDRGQPFVNEGLGELAFQHPRYIQSAYNRYVAIPLMSPRMAKRLRTPNEKWCLHSKFLVTRLTPFDGSIDCYGGDSWFTANRRIANLLLDETPLWQTLHRHFRSRSIPEESFYHTLLGNTQGLRISPDNRRYTDWKGCYAHPRTLGREDFPRLLESTDHFARKFPFDQELLRDLGVAVSSNALRV
jgi:Core-2/I-Branching enzyme